MKIFSCSTHLSIKSKILINIEIAKSVVMIVVVFHNDDDDEMSLQSFHVQRHRLTRLLIRLMSILDFLLTC